MTKTITYNIRHHLRKLISIVVILSFTTTNVYGYAGPTLFKKKSHAQRYLKDEARKDYGDVVSSPSLLGISQNLGQVVEWHKADADKGRLIIHIQDHHADPTAQLNIAGVLDELTQKYDTHLMCLEGASRELDTAFYDKFEDGKIKEKVARFFVEKGLFTGAEYFKVTRKDLYLKAKGAEDENLYIKHLASYKKNQPNKTEHLRQLSSIRNSLNQLKQKAYSKDLKQIDSVSTSYALKQIKLPKYLRTLARYAKKTKIGTSEYKDLKGFLALLDKEKDIDFKKAEAQRELLIKELAKTLKEEELKGLVVKSLNFRLNKISTEAFYAYLKDLHTQTQQKSQPYKELLSYIDYLKFSKTINHLNLFDEAEDLDEKIKAALCKNNTQRKLAAYSKATKLLNDLYSLKLTRKHLDYIESHPEVYDIANIASFLKDACPRYGLNAPTVIARSEATKQSLSFYTLALERDKALIDNTLKNMKRHRKDKAALVTGGFHTQGITNILKEKNISYVVICPNIDTEEREALYDAKMAGSLPGIPEMAEFFTQMLNTPLVTASGTSKQAVHAQRMFASLFCGATIFDTLDGDMLKRAVARKLLILQGLQQAASSEDPLTAKGADRIVRSCLEMEHVPEPAQQLRASSSGEMLALIGETVPPPIEIKIEKKGTASDGKKAASSGEALRSATEYLVAAGQTVFVTVACKLNVDRSPLAEGIIRRNLSNDLKGVVEIESCGTDVEEAGAEPRAKDACEARGIELSDRGAQQLTQEMVDKADIIITVHKKQQRRIEELFPDAKHKIRLI
ncbi:MAG: hypothetical protein HQ558_03615, partial [Candidatus Omnitrophica bacterium]|nr:hypothetical protein [Candidatus Omnitrophota bacterium]